MNTSFVGTSADDAEAIPIPEPIDALRMTVDAQKRMLNAALEREAEYRMTLSVIKAMAERLGIKSIQAETEKALGYPELKTTDK